MISKIKMEHLGAKHCARSFVQITLPQSHHKPVSGITSTLQVIVEVLGTMEPWGPCKWKICHCPSLTALGSTASLRAVAPACLLASLLWHQLVCSLSTGLTHSSCFLESFEHGPSTRFSTPSSPLCFGCLLTASSSWTTCSGLMRDDLRSHPHWGSATSRLEGGLSQARFPFCFISLWLRAWGSAFSFTQQIFFWELTSHQPQGHWGCITSKAQSPCSPWTHPLSPGPAVMRVADILAWPVRR